MNALIPTFTRVYKDENVNKSMMEAMLLIENNALERMKNDPAMFDFFVEYLKGDGVTIGDAWRAVLFEMAEEWVQESIGKERKLRADNGIVAPEDEKPIDFSYVSVR